MNFVNSTRDPPKKIKKARCYPNLLLESPFGSCKSISGKCFHVFGCISKNVSENIFQCLVVFLKIPQKTHFLLVTHIFLVAKRIYNIIHSSIQKHKQNLEKKSSNLVTFSRLPNNRNTNKHRNKNIPVKYRNTNIFWV